MGTITSVKRNPSLRDEVIRMKIKDELRNELITKDLFNEKMKAIDERFVALEEKMDVRFKATDQRIDHLEIKMDQRIGNLEMKMDERFKRTDLKMNIIIGLSLLAMTLFNPKFMDIMSKLLK